MIDLKVELSAADQKYVQDTFDSLKKIMTSKELNKHRAQSFKSFTKKALRDGNIRLVPLSEITIFLAGAHNPEHLTGKMLDEMKVEAAENNSAIVGYWEPSKKVPGKKITYSQLAMLQHTGYRIPLTGPEGKKVRGWLAKKGVFSATDNSRNKKTFKNIIAAGKWLLVPPRPFMPRSLDLYLELDKDSEAVHNYIEKVLK